MDSPIPDIEALEERFEELTSAIRLEEKREEKSDVEERMAQPGFWDDPDTAQTIVRRCSALKNIVEPMDELAESIGDARILAELALEEEDEETLSEVRREIAGVEETLEDLELQALLSEEHDDKDAYVNIQAGTGGTDACDWAEILLRLYVRWAEGKGFGSEIVDRNGGEEAGIKSATLKVEGPNAFGWLRSEAGVHRLIRISPFDAQGRRQTSFAAVDVLPVVDRSVDIEIDPSDIRRDTFRASGAGGQHVNKTESAVRLTHHPSGVVVSCQNERSQHRNEKMAMELLKAKLVRLEERKREEELQQLYSDKGEIAWGNQIRSYFIHPEQRVKDHRTNTEMTDTTRVLDGDIDPFIEAYLKQRLHEKSKGKKKKKKKKAKEKATS